MNSKFLLAVMLASFSITLFAQNSSKDEMAIKQVIEDETKYFMARDFDKWANCVAHDPMTFFSWTSPFAGENGIMENHGWENLSAAVKEYMTKHQPNEKETTRSNYQIRLKGDMAFVTFKENETVAGSRVMEKINGNWKILRMDAIASNAFQNFHQLYALQKMAGSWEIDLSSYQKEGGGTWKLQSCSVDIDRVPTGIQIRETARFIDKNGQPKSAESFAVYSVDMENNKIGIFNSVYYPHSNWTESYAGEGAFNDQKVFEGKGRQVGDQKSNAVFTMGMDGNDIKYTVDVTDETGKKVFMEKYTMRRTSSSERATASIKP